MIIENFTEINELNADTLALESALVLDMFFGDDEEDDIAMEAEFGVTKDYDTKAQSYSARIGKKTYYDQVSKSDPLKRRMGYTIKKIWRAMLVGIINFFKAIGNGMRKILQVILIPLNALIMAVTGVPETKVLAAFTREEKQVWNVLSKRAQREISDVGTDALNIIEKRIDKVMLSTEKIAAFTEKVALTAKTYDMRSSDKLGKSKFDELSNEYRDNKEGFDSEESKLNEMLNNIERSKESIRAEALKLGSKFYKDAVLRYMCITKEECNKAIRKCKELINFSNERVRDCERLQSCEEVSSDAKSVAELYRNSAALSKRIARYFGTTLGKFGIKANVTNEE